MLRAKILREEMMFPRRNSQVLVHMWFTKNWLIFSHSIWGSPLPMHYNISNSHTQGKTERIIISYPTICLILYLKKKLLLASFSHAIFYKSFECWMACFICSWVAEDDTIVNFPTVRMKRRMPIRVKRKRDDH